MKRRLVNIELLSEACLYIEDHQWSVRNAAENYYCGACEKDSDMGKDQVEHHEGCSTLKLLDALRALLNDVDVPLKYRQPVRVR